MKLVTKKLLICVPLAVVFVWSILSANGCIDALINGDEIGGSFWTPQRRVTTLITMLLITNNALIALIYFACKKPKREKSDNKL